ncbi:MAG: hypothetical protein IPK26_14760 [Planctomycetes bacterium]|nr:hypothetical protein [Planctomycetota bacterium]
MIAVTDPQGSATLRPGAERYQVSCSAHGFKPIDRDLEVSGLRQELVVELEPGEPLATGMVVEDDTGREVPDARVTVLSANWSQATGRPDLTARTDDRGRFTVSFDTRITSAVLASVKVVPPPSRTDLATLSTDVVFGSPSLVLRMLSSRPRIRVVIGTDRRDAPMEWTVATAMLSDADPAKKTDWKPIERDANGLFTVPAGEKWYSDGWFRLTSNGRTVATAYSRLVDLPSAVGPFGRVHEWAAPEPVAIDVEVRSVATSAPLAGALVELLFMNGEIENARGASAIADYDPLQHLPWFSRVAQLCGQGTTDAQGLVRVATAVREKHYLRASLPGYRTSMAIVTDSRRVVMDLTAVGHADGVLVGWSGRGVICSVVSGQPEDAERWTPGRQVELSADGKFRLVGHPPGRYELHLREPQLNMFCILGEIEVANPPPPTVTFRVPQMAAYRVDVASTQFRVGDHLHMSAIGVGAFRDVAVSEPGHAFVDLCPGTYRVVRVRGSGAGVSVVFATDLVQVSANGPREHQLAFVEQSGRVRLMRGPRPAASQWVRTEGISAGVAMAASYSLTDQDGWLQMTMVPAGEFVLIGVDKFLTRFTDTTDRWRVRSVDLGGSVDATR